MSEELAKQLGEAWANEDAWRAAVRKIYGTEGYVLVLREAVRQRHVFMLLKQAECSHPNGVPCHACELGMTRS